MTDPTHEQPPTLVERLRNTAINLTTTYVAVDANGDPIGQPRDGSEEADFEQFDDPVEFEPEELHDLANLYREAATALVAHESEILSRDERIAILESQIAATRKQAFFGALHDGEVARDLTVYTSGLDALHVVLTGLLNAEPALDLEVFPVDPATGERKLEGEGGLEMATRLLLLAAERGAFGGRTGARPGLTTGELIRDAIAAIRTDARVIEASRTNLKAWHSWARKIGRAEGDEFAGAMPSTLQARISRQVEAGQLALLVEPIRRRVELALALCEDMGLGGPEAAELAPKAALWTDAEVAEIEAFRMKDWSDTGLNPFDHLPAALERTVYPNGGRRAYLKRAGEPLPPEAPTSAEHQLGLPGLPKPETAMRLRLALIDKPDSPEAALIAGFAQVMLEGLSDIATNCHHLPEHKQWTTWTTDDADNLRAEVRKHIEKASSRGQPMVMALYCAWAWHYGWSLAQDRHAHLDQVDRDILAAKPEDRANVLLEGLQQHMDARAPSELPPPPGYTLWVSMGNTGWAIHGMRVADDVIDAWSHHLHLTSWHNERLRALIKAAQGSRTPAEDRNEFGGWLVTTFQPGAVDEAAVICPGGEFESADEFCRRALQLALDRGAFAPRRDPPPMVAPSKPLDTGAPAPSADLAEQAQIAADNLRAAMGHTPNVVK